MHDLIKLAYVGARGDIEKWRTFGTDLHGMQASMDGGKLYLRLDEKSWRFEIDPHGEPGCAFLGFEWDSLDAYEAMMARVKAAGHEIVEDSDLARKRQVKRLAWLMGPGNIPYEFCLGQMKHSEPFISPLGTKFVTGAQGMGHLGILVEDQDAADAFLINVMGLRHTDTFNSPRGHVTFLRGSGRHHLIVTIPASGKQGLQHVFVEVDQLPTLGRAWDKIQAGAAPIMNSLGQHTNDPAVSYYCRSPSGFGFEYGWDSLVVDDENWAPVEWAGGDLWGHMSPTAGESASK